MVIFGVFFLIMKDLIVVCFRLWFRVVQIIMVLVCLLEVMKIFLLFSIQWLLFWVVVVWIVVEFELQFGLVIVIVVQVLLKCCNCFLLVIVVIVVLFSFWCGMVRSRLMLFQYSFIMLSNVDRLLLFLMFFFICLLVCLFVEVVLIVLGELLFMLFSKVVSRFSFFGQVCLVLLYLCEIGWKQFFVI